MSKLPPEVSKRIRGRPYYAYLYARNVLKSRLPARIEVCFKDDPQSACLYAKEVIGGKLPDLVHNALMLYSLEKKDVGGHVAEYLKWLEGK